MNHLGSFLSSNPVNHNFSISLHICYKYVPKDVNYSLFFVVVVIVNDHVVVRCDGIQESVLKFCHIMILCYITLLYYDI